ncbi:MAG: TetR/AcrR family transcriptional regulator [Gammaproteobacteria bacterium]|nr:TetR/AcrR family transcriptional regulator [Gammaproteobacteria bacterium]
MARPQAADYDDRRRSILEQAAALFAEKGFPRTSIAELAQACNASKSWLYHYYPSKEAVLYDIMSDHIGRLLEATEESLAAGGDAGTRLRRLARALMEIYGGARTQHTVLVNDLGCLPEKQRKEIVRLEKRLLEKIGALLQEINPRLSTVPALRTPSVMLFMGMLNWTYTWYDESGAISPVEFADLAADVFLDGFSATGVPDYS